jgi:hypothetical protein
MKYDLENSFLLVYLSGPLIITHGPLGAAPVDPLSVGLPPSSPFVIHGIVFLPRVGLYVT